MLGLYWYSYYVKRNNSRCARGVVAIAVGAIWVNHLKTHRFFTSNFRLLNALQGRSPASLVKEELHSR